MIRRITAAMLDVIQNQEDFGRRMVPPANLQYDAVARMILNLIWRTIPRQQRIPWATGRTLDHFLDSLRITESESGAQFAQMDDAELIRRIETGPPEQILWVRCVLSRWAAYRGVTLPVDAGLLDHVRAIRQAEQQQVDGPTANQPDTGIGPLSDGDPPPASSSPMPV